MDSDAPGRIRKKQSVLYTGHDQAEKYSYVSSLQSANLFREAFLLRQKDVKVNDDSVDTYYYEGGQNMAALHDDQVVKFETTVSESDETDLFMQSADYIRRLGNNFGTIRFLIG